MSTRVILTVLGSDRPGLTQSVADAVLAAGGNWLESHLSRLGGKYVGAVLVDLSGGDPAALEREIRKIDAGGLEIAMVSAGEEPVAGEVPAAGQIGIEVVGQDRPGIVREVTTRLSALGVNIEDFTSRTENSAWSGEKLFRAQARLTLPPGVTFDGVRGALEDISGEIMVDFSLRKGG